MSASGNIARGLALVAWELIKFPFVLLRVLFPALTFGARLYIAASAFFYEGDFEPAYAIAGLAFALALHGYAHRGASKVGALASCLDCVVAGIALALLGAWGLFPHAAPAITAWALSGALFYSMSGAVSAATQGDKVKVWHKRRKLDALRPKEKVAPTLQTSANQKAEEPQK